MRIRNQLFLSFFPVTGGVLVACGLMAYFMMEEAMREQASRHLESIADGRKAHLEEVIERKRSTLNLVASRTNMRKLLATTPPGWREELALILRQAVQGETSVSAIFLTDTNGEILVTTNPAWNGTRFRESPHFPRVLKEPILLDGFLYDEKGKTLDVLSAAPVVWMDRRIGYVGVVGSSSRFLNALAGAVHIGKTGNTLISIQREPDELLILGCRHPGARIFESHTRSSLSTNLPSVRAAAGFEGLLPRAMNHHQGEVFAVTRYLPDPGWGLVVMQDRREILAPIRALARFFAILISGAVILLFVLSLYNARCIGKPLVRMARHAKKLRMSEIKTPLHLHAGAQSEELRVLDQELKSLTEDLLAANETVAAMLQAAPVAILSVDLDGRITMANTKATQLTGYSSEELLTHTVEDLVPEDMRSLHVALRAGFAGKEEGRCMGRGLDVRLLRKDGGAVPVEIGLSPVTVGGKKQFLVSVSDLTWRMGVEDEREKLVVSFQQAARHLKLIQRVVPFCAKCGTIQTPTGEWVSLDTLKKTDTANGCPNCREAKNG